MADRIISINRYIKENLLKSLLIAYAIFALLSVAYMGANYVLSCGRDRTELSVSDFELVDCEVAGDMEIITETEDSQMIYTGNIYNLYVKCNFSQPEGEFVAFYSKDENHSFGTNRMAYAKVYGDWYVFNFPYGTRQIRLDPGVTISNTVTFESIIANNDSPRDRFKYSTSLLFISFTGAPALLFGLSTAVDILEKFKKRA